MPTIRTIAAALCIIGTLAWPSAQAGLRITTLDPLDGGLLNHIDSGALDLHWSDMTTGSGVASQARYFETRRSQLYKPAIGGLETLDLIADSGWSGTQQIGHQVGAHASLDVQPDIFIDPAAARSTLFGNHVRAHSGDRYTMVNDVEVTLGGTTYPPLTIHQSGFNRADARSAWYDTWQAKQTAVYPLTLRLDGSFGHFSRDGVCLVTTPAGITSYKRLSRQMDFQARFTVLDLDSFVDCDDPDACGTTGPRPKAVAQLTADYRHDDDDAFPLWHDSTHTLDFTTIAGHRYLVIGVMEADASNGGLVSFDNSFRLTGVAAPVGALSSSALNGDLASGFQQPVPEPATALLLAGGLAGLCALRRRTRTG